MITQCEIYNLIQNGIPANLLVMISFQQQVYVLFELVGSFLALIYEKTAAYF